MTDTTVPQPPFRTKKSVREAMTLGSRWAMEHLDSDDSYVGTIVRATSTSRWVMWDDDGPEDRPTWLPVGDTKGWVVDDDGFTEGDSGTRLRFVAAAPADVDPAYYARVAMPRNRREGPCVECGGHVPAGEGHVQQSYRTWAWEALHAYGACTPVEEPTTLAA